MLKDLVVDLNKLVKIRFSDGYELLIRIVEQKKIDEINPSEELKIDTKTPAAQAILGRRIGEKIEYLVEENIQQVSILGIE